MHKNNNTTLIILLLLLCQVVTVPLAATTPTKKKSATTPTERYEETAQFTYYYYEALRCMEMREFDNALLLLRHCIAINPNSSAVNLLLGDLYAMLGWNEAATHHKALAVELDPTNWEYRRNYADFLGTRKSVGDIIPVIKAETKLNPSNKEAWSILAYLYAQTGQNKEAVAALNKIEQLHGIDQMTSIEKCRIYLSSGNLKKAIAEIDKLIVEIPQESRFKVLKADLLLMQGKVAEATQIYHETIEKTPESPYAYQSLAEYYSKTEQPNKALDVILKALAYNQIEVEVKLALLGQYAEQIKTHKEQKEQIETLLQSLIDQYPLEEKVYEFYVQYLLSNHQTEEAEKALQTMTYINPQNQDTWEMLINMAIGRNNISEILSITEQALQQLPNNLKILLVKGSACAMLQNNELAIETLEHALTVAPHEELAYRLQLFQLLGNLYSAEKEIEKSIEAYESALAINPNDIAVLNNYAYLLAEQGVELRKAERMSAKTIEKSPNESIYLDTYAWIFYKQNSLSLAKFYIERAIDNLPKENQEYEIWEHYGYILKALEKPAEAIAAWKKAVEINSERNTLLEKEMEALQKNLTNE